MIQTAGKYKISKQDFHDSLNINVNLCWIDNSFLDKDFTKYRQTQLFNRRITAPKREMTIFYV
jgi:hypothetical protein